MENNKEHRMIFRVSEKEYHIIKRKCELSHSKNMSAFIRRMVLYGLGVNFPEELLQKFYRTVGGAANNINQIAVRYNSSNRIYNEDIDNLKTAAVEIQKQLRALQSQISKIHF